LNILILKISLGIHSARCKLGVSYYAKKLKTAAGLDGYYWSCN